MFLLPFDVSPHFTTEYIFNLMVASKEYVLPPSNNHKYPANINSPSLPSCSWYCLCVCVRVCVREIAPQWLYLAIVPSPGSLIVNELNPSGWRRR